MLRIDKLPVRVCRLGNALASATQPCSSRRIGPTSNDGRAGVGAPDASEGEEDGAMEDMEGDSVGPPMMGAVVGLLVGKTTRIK